MWRGSGSAIYLELGKLERVGKRNPSGEYTIAIEWSWRIENTNSIVIGTWSEENRLNDAVEMLVGRTVKRVSFFGRLKELEIEFREALWLTSFATVEGDPEWAIKYHENKWLSYMKGRFVIDDTPNKALNADP